MKKIFFIVGITLIVFILNSCDLFDPCKNGHTFNEWEIVNAPTCTENGLKKHVCCECNYEETEVLQATGHQYDDGIITLEPTCTETGIKTFTCINCSEKKEETLNPYGHNFDTGLITKEATCTEQGEKTYTCKNCTFTKIEKIAAKGHHFDEGVITTYPTCTEPGIKTFTCENCSITETEKINALGHNFDGIKCTVCDEYSITIATVGTKYIDNKKTDGMEFTLNTFEHTTIDGYNDYFINYTLKNTIPGSEIGPGVFKIIYKTTNGYGSQFQNGFFNNLYYNDTQTRSYTFRLTSEKTFVCIEYIPDSLMIDYIFTEKITDNLLNFVIQ